MNLMKATIVAQKLDECLKLMKRVHGDKWPEVSKETREMIARIMKARNTHNPLEVVLPAAQEMQRDGQNPTFLLAIAAEMSSEEKTPCKR